MPIVSYKCIHTLRPWEQNYIKMLTLLMTLRWENLPYNLKMRGIQNTNLFSNHQNSRFNDIGKTEKISKVRDS